MRTEIPAGEKSTGTTTDAPTCARCGARLAHRGTVPAYEVDEYQCPDCGRAGARLHRTVRRDFGQCFQIEGGA